MSNEQAVRAIFDATNRRKWDAALAGYDEEVVLVAMPGAVDPGVYHGREALARYFGSWLEAFGRDTRYEVVATEQGRDGLYAHVRQTVRGRESGVGLANEFFCAYWFRRGKVVRAEMHQTAADARAAVGA